MTQQLVGYHLRQTETGDIIQSWGGTWGQCPGVPNPVVLPNGDQICAPVVGDDYQGFNLAEWRMDEPPPPVPTFISDRQFYQQAALVGIISHTEALAAVQTGTIPSVLQNIIDAEPDANKRFAMEMMLAGATVFERNHPMTSPIGAALGLTEAEIDQFFIDAAKL